MPVGCLHGVAFGLGAFGNDNYTNVLLHFDGADGSTTLTDRAASTATPTTWTANGNAQIDTAQFKFGGASGLFDGTGDYWTAADSSLFTLGAGDWTLDFWFNWNGGSGVRGFACGQCNSAGATTSTSLAVEHRTTNAMRAGICVGGAALVLDSTTTITTTGWHHLAIVGDGGTGRLYLDGVHEASGSIGGTPNDSTNNWSIGRAGEITTTTWNGWLDELRLSVGIARWKGTGSFTPPPCPYGQPGTV